MGLEADTFPLGPRTEPHHEARCGERSASWRIRSGGIVLTVAKARAALLQIAHPKIAAGLIDHSTFESDPYRRVRITGQTMAAIRFGSSRERSEALRLLRGVHAGVRGSTPAGSTYRATDPELLWFVLATLIESDLLVEETYLHLFDERDRDAYYDESMGLVEAFRIPPNLVPDTRAGLREYVTATCSDLDVGPDALRLAAKIFEPTFLRLARGPLVWGYRSILVDLLPARLKMGYGFGDRRPPAERAVVAAARLALPRVPTRLRRVPLHPTRRPAR